MPTQLKAITHLIVQPYGMRFCTRNHLLRFKGLIALQYVLEVGPFDVASPQAFVNREEQGFGDSKLENLVELSQLRSVKIALIAVLREQSMLVGGTEPVPDAIKAWVGSAERRMMGLENAQSGQ